MSWLYLPESVASNLESSSPDPTLELSVTSSGTPMLRPLSWRGWKTRPWVKRLSGTMLSPSTAARGMVRWIASLAASRVRTSASPARAQESKENARASGLSTLASFARFDPDTSSLRTSQPSLFGDSTECCVTLPPSGSMRNGMCFQRQESERRTFAAGSSFSRNEYPTPAASTYGKNQGGGAESGTGPRRPSLDAWARKWPTPDAQQFGNATSANWMATPEVSRWGTPRVSMANGPSESEIAKGDPKVRLETQVALWATPTAGDSKASGSAGYSTESGRHEGVTLTDQTVRGFTGPQDREIPKDGAPTSPPGVLNPAFVEALMGLPIGWTDCDVSVTESFLRWLQERGRPSTEEDQ